MPRPGWTNGRLSVHKIGVSLRSFRACGVQYEKSMLKASNA